MSPRRKQAPAAVRSAGVNPLPGKLAAPVTVIALIALWQLVCSVGLVPSFLLPSPVAVVEALVEDWPLLVGHAATSLAEAAVGLGCGIALGFAAAILMDRFELVYRAFYPLVVLTQTVPTVAIAPLLVLWFGYGMLPKVVLIVITTFSPSRWGCSTDSARSTRTLSTSCVPWGRAARRSCATRSFRRHSVTCSRV